jgi:hypothetical protein
MMTFSGAVGLSTLEGGGGFSSAETRRALQYDERYYRIRLWRNLLVGRARSGGLKLRT